MTQRWALWVAASFWYHLVVISIHLLADCANLSTADPLFGFQPRLYFIVPATLRSKRTFQGFTAVYAFRLMRSCEQRRSTLPLGYGHFFCCCAPDQRYP
jgi:hypothetical protein